MITSYNQVSKEVGYEGYMPFPPIEEMEMLLHRLSSNPNLSDFKRALSLYRFVLEARTEEQQKIVYMLQMGLCKARKTLFVPKGNRSYAEVAINYIMNFVPSLTVFYMVRYMVVSQDLFFQF